MIMHSEAYKWNASDRISPILSDIVDRHVKKASLTGGKVTPRMFVRAFISVLDTVQQNQNHFKKSEDILELFEDKEGEVGGEEFPDDFDFDDDEDW